MEKNRLKIIYQDNYYATIYLNGRAVVSMEEIKISKTNIFPFIFAGCTFHYYFMNDINPQKHIFNSKILFGISDGN